MLKGNKTYLAAAGGFLSGDATLREAVVPCFSGLGLATLRLGVKTEIGGGQ